jgi:hypothetical protein
MASLLVEPENVYHSRAGECLSSHLLRSFWECPQLYHDIITGEFIRPDTGYYILGRALHTLILEGKEKFDNTYVSDSPINPTTDKPYGCTTKKYMEWATAMRNDELEPIAGDQMILLKKMAKSIANHKEASWLLSMALYRERVIRLQYQGLFCQIRMDALGKEVGIVDFKTCDKLSRLPYAARDYGYYAQLAFYRTILRESRLEFSSDVHIIASEKQYPYRCGVWHVSQCALDEAEEDNGLLIEELKVCMVNDTWPTRYEDLRELTTAR